MLREYAFEPSLVQDADVYRLLSEQLGIDQGRLLGHSCDWFKRAWEALDEANPDMLRMELLAQLQGPDSRQFCQQRHPTCSGDDDGRRGWFEIAIDSHQMHPFELVVTDSEPDGRIPNRRIASPSEVGTHDKWKRGMGAPQVDKQPKSIVEALGVFPSASCELRFVDPYFNPAEERWRDLPRSVIQSALGPPFSSMDGKLHVEFHTSWNEDKVERYGTVESMVERYWPDFLRHSCNSVSSAHLVVWDHIVLKEDHDRFLISEIGCFAIGAGFDCGTRGAIRTTVNWMDSETSQRLYNKFSALTSNHSTRIHLVFDQDGTVVHRRPHRTVMNG